MSKRLPMTKPDAIGVIFQEVKSNLQPRPREFRRLLRALGVLGLSTEEMRDACRQLDIVSPAGKLWRDELQPLAPWPVERPERDQVTARLRGRLTASEAST